MVLRLASRWAAVWTGSAGAPQEAIVFSVSSTAPAVSAAISTAANDVILRMDQSFSPVLVSPLGCSQRKYMRLVQEMC
jgi:hypothetical protein